MGLFLIFCSLYAENLVIESLYKSVRVPTDCIEWQRSTFKKEIYDNITVIIPAIVDTLKPYRKVQQIKLPLVVLRKIPQGIKPFSRIFALLSSYAIVKAIKDDGNEIEVFVDKKILEFYLNGKKIDSDAILPTPGHGFWNLAGNDIVMIIRDEVGEPVLISIDYDDYRIIEHSNLLKFITKDQLSAGANTVIAMYINNFNINKRHKFLHVKLPLIIIVTTISLFFLLFWMKLKKRKRTLNGKKQL